MSIIKDKKVLLIGGHDSEEENKLDKYDIVVRCNTNYTYPARQTDILYLAAASCINLLKSNMQDPKLSHVYINKRSANTILYTNVVKTAKKDYSYFIRYNKQADYQERKTPEAQFQFAYDFIPFTGVFALYHLATMSPSSIYVTGMNFYTDPKTGVPPMQLYKFDMYKQAVAMMDTAIRHPYINIQFDPVLYKAIDYVLGQRPNPPETKEAA